MTAEVQQNASPEGAQPKPSPPSSFFRQFLRLAGPYWNSEEKWKVRGLTALLVALTILQVFTPIMVNLWSARLFDALEQRSMDRFLSLVGALGFILVYAMAVTAIHLWIKRRLQLGWRRWLTKRLLNSWMEEG
ncbi:MAG TPA: ABC transporter ATP-binding protein/permease, partial [Candidatus Omnitrophota bacterium]|nr:ABC transporter ATP-binding protein/permease [Candidatus Omnitrophota bacterium]